MKTRNKYLKKEKNHKRKSHKRREKAGRDDRESLQNFMESIGLRELRIREFRNLLVDELVDSSDERDKDPLDLANFLKYIKKGNEKLVSSIITMQYYKRKPFNSLQERTAKAIKISNALIDFFIKVLRGESLSEAEIQLIDIRAIDEYLKNEKQIKLYLEQIRNITAIDRLGLETAVRGESRRNDFVKESQKYKIKAVSRG